MKHLIVAITVWAFWTGLLTWLLHRLFPGNPGQSLALWFQAVGSIGAVFAAFFIAWRQSTESLATMRNTQRGRRNSILAVADAALEQVRHFEEILTGQNARAHMIMEYDKSIVEGIVEALSNVPVHEIGSQEGVTALLKMTDQFRRLGVVMQKYLDGPTRDPEAQQMLESNWNSGPTPAVAIRDFERIFGENVRTQLDAIKRYYEDMKMSIRTLNQLEAA